MTSGDDIVGQFIGTQDDPIIIDDGDAASLSSLSSCDVHFGIEVGDGGEWNITSTTFVKPNEEVVHIADSSSSSDGFDSCLSDSTVSLIVKLLQKRKKRRRKRYVSLFMVASIVRPSVRILEARHDLNHVQLRSAGISVIVIQDPHAVTFYAVTVGTLFECDWLAVKFYVIVLRQVESIHSRSLTIFCLPFFSNRSHPTMAKRGKRHARPTASSRRSSRIEDRKAAAKKKEIEER